MNPHDQQKLERLIHQTLREAGTRRAPSTLEARVMAEIARRAALPWWKQNFAYWPVGVRVTFLAAAAVVVAAILWGVGGINVTPLRDTLATRFAWVDAAAVLGRMVRESISATIDRIPPLWLWGAVAVVASLYTALFGLGAAAYRTLYAAR